MCSCLITCAASGNQPGAQTALARIVGISTNFVPRKAISAAIHRGEGKSHGTPIGKVDNPDCVAAKVEEEKSVGTNCAIYKQDGYLIFKQNAPWGLPIRLGAHRPRGFAWRLEIAMGFC